MNDLTGNSFHRLTVLSLSHFKKGYAQWLCQCECGNQTVVNSDSLRSGHTRSCGCLQKERVSEANTKHGYVGTGTFTSWAGMRQRCHNPNDQAYKNYGGRGIRVCDRWQESFKNFLADMGERPDGYSIERIDVNGNYEPTNCTWIPLRNQIKNRRLSYQALRILRSLSVQSGISGVDISKESGIVSGTLYPILAKFEKAKWLRSERGLRPPKRFYFTPLGRREAEDVLAKSTSPARYRGNSSK